MNPKRVKLDENETAKVGDPEMEDHPIQKFPLEVTKCSSFLILVVMII